jgi:hypothetical protein
MRSRVLAASVLGAAVVVMTGAGCASDILGSASPTTGASQIAPATSTQPNSNGTNPGGGSAPKVNHPLDASGLLTSPCSALTPSDLVGLGVVHPITGEHNTDEGADCGWTGTSGGTVGVTWVTANTNGLADLYANQPTMAYWQPTTVSGYPAVYGDALIDQRSQGDCVLDVGVNDHLYFFVDFNDPAAGSSSCPRAERAAADVIKAIPGGS